MPVIQYTAAGGVVVNGGKILVLRRPGRGEVRLPKGHVEENEPLDKAARREIAEESGYADIEIIGDLGQQTVEFDYQGDHIVRNELYYLVNLRSLDQIERMPYEYQFIPDWLTWDEALSQLSFEAEREWVHRARKQAS